MIHHIALRVRDVEAVTTFYERVFGLRRVRETAGYSIWLGLGDAVLMLEQASGQEPTPDRASQELLAFRHPPHLSQAALEELLREEGCRIESRTQHTLYFRDPEGRRVAVSQYPLPELRAGDSARSESTRAE